MSQWTLLEEQLRARDAAGRRSRSPRHTPRVSSRHRTSRRNVPLPGQDLDVTSYYAWNDSLAARFFRPDLADAPVHFWLL